MRRSNRPRAGKHPDTQQVCKAADEIPAGSGSDVTTDQFKTGEARDLRTQPFAQTLVVQGLRIEPLAINADFTGTPWPIQRAIGFELKSDIIETSERKYTFTYKLSFF